LLFVVCCLLLFVACLLLFVDYVLVVMCCLVGDGCLLQLLGKSKI